MDKNFPLAVVGRGAVTPAGLGEDGLRRERAAVPVAPLGRPEETWPVFRVDPSEPALIAWQKEPRLRRASPLTLYLVAAAAQALRGLSAEQKAETGVVAAFSVGCLAYSRRFYESIVVHGQKTASPALFPETVFNSPLSHVVAVHGLNGAAYALVGDETAWIAALRTAAVWLQKKRVAHVLVLGGEEFDPLALDAYRSARWLRRGRKNLPFRASEGAGAILVRAARDGDPVVIAQARDGFIYRTRAEAAATAQHLFQNAPPDLALWPTASRNFFGPLEKRAAAHRPQLGAGLPYLGEAFTASAAWHTLRACAAVNEITPALLLPIWGLNHQFGFLKIAAGTTAPSASRE
jgi:hypothetical protein